MNMNKYIQDPGFWESKKLEKLSEMVDVQEKLVDRIADLSVCITCLNIIVTVLLLCLIFVIGIKKV